MPDLDYIWTDTKVDIIAKKQSMDGSAKKDDPHTAKVPAATKTLDKKMRSRRDSL